MPRGGRFLGDDAEIESMYRLTAFGFVPTLQDDEFWERRYASNRIGLVPSTRKNHDVAIRKWIVFVARAIMSKRYHVSFVGMADNVGIVCDFLEDVMAQMRSESSINVLGTLQTCVQALSGLKKCQAGGVNQQDGWNSGGDQISAIMQRAAKHSAIEKSLAPTDVDGSYLTNAELVLLYSIAQSMPDSYIGIMFCALVGIGIFGFMRFQDLSHVRLAHCVLGEPNRFVGPHVLNTIAVGVRNSQDKDQKSGVPKWYSIVEHLNPYECPAGFLADHTISLLQHAPIIQMIRAGDARWHDYHMFSRKDPMAALESGTYYWLDSCCLGKVLDIAGMVKAQGKEFHLLRNTLASLLQQHDCEYVRTQKKARRDCSVQERNYETRIPSKDQPTDALLGGYGKDYMKHHILGRRTVPLPSIWQQWAEELVPGVFDALHEVKAFNTIHNSARKERNKKKKSIEEKARNANALDAERFLEFVLEMIRIFLANLGLKIDQLGGPENYQMTRAIPAALRIFLSKEYQSYAVELRRAHEDGLALFDRLTKPEDPLAAEDRIAQRVIASMRTSVPVVTLNTPEALLLEPIPSFITPMEPMSLNVSISTPQAKLIMSDVDLSVHEAYREFYHGLLGEGGVQNQRARIGKLCLGDVTKISKRKHLPIKIYEMVECDEWDLEGAISVFQEIKDRFQLTIAKLRECVQYTFPSVERKGKANKSDWNPDRVLKGVKFTLREFLEATGLARDPQLLPKIKQTFVLVEEVVIGNTKRLKVD